MRKKFEFVVLGLFVLLFSGCLTCPCLQEESRPLASISVAAKATAAPARSASAKALKIKEAKKSSSAELPKVTEATKTSSSGKIIYSMSAKEILAKAADDSSGEKNLR